MHDKIAFLINTLFFGRKCRKTVKKHFYLPILLTVVLVILAFNHNIQQYFLSQFKIDSLGHFFTFFVLTGILTCLVKLRPLITTLTLTFYAGASELGQAYLGFRNGEFSDFIADVIGIISFVILYWLIKGINNYLFHPKITGKK